MCCFLSIFSTAADHRGTLSVTAAADDDNDDTDNNSVPFIPISQFNKMIPQVVLYNHIMSWWCNEHVTVVGSTFENNDQSS